MNEAKSSTLIADSNRALARLRISALSLASVSLPLRDYPTALLACALAITARDALVSGNMGLAWRFAYRYRRAAEHFGQSEEDLAQLGGMAILAAVDHYDPARPEEFITYAGRAAEYRVRKHLSRLSSGRAGLMTVSMDGDPDGDGAMAELIPDHRDRDVPYEPNELKRLEDALTRLPARQLRALRLRLGLGGERPMNYEEIGAIIGTCDQTAANLEASAIDALRVEFGLPSAKSVGKFGAEYERRMAHIARRKAGP